MIGDTVYIFARRDGNEVLSSIDASTGAERWRAGTGGFFMSPLLVTLGGVPQVVSVTQQNVIGVSVENGAVLCDADMGWRWHGAGRCPSCTGDNLLFLLNDNAELIVVRARPTAFEPVKRYTVAESATWAQPAISGKRIFVKDLNSLTLWSVD